MIECRTLEGFRTSRDGLRRAKLACAHADGPPAASVGSALPVLKYVSTFRAGDARGAAAGWVAGWSVASRPSLPAARLVGRILRDIGILGFPKGNETRPDRQPPWERRFSGRFFSRWTG